MYVDELQSYETETETESSLYRMVMDRRQDQIPKMLDARSKGKIAYFVRDRLIIKENRQEGSSNSVPVEPQRDDSEVSFTLAN